MKVLLLGASGRVGSALGPRLREAGHEVTEAGRDDVPDLGGHDVAIDFTRPDAVRANVERCSAAGVLGRRWPDRWASADDDVGGAQDEPARTKGVPCLVVPNSRSAPSS